MIARHWTGLVKKERAGDYISHLRQKTFKELGAIRGFSKATILKRDTPEGVEFLIVTEWETTDAIKQFAGPEYDTAVVGAYVQELMIRYDPKVRHYEVD